MAIKKIVQVFHGLGLSTFLAKQAQNPNGWFAPIAIKMMNDTNKDLEYLGLDLINIQGNEDILEVGFGNGRIMAEMCKKLDTGKIYGIDISVKMIADCSNRLKHEIKQGKIKLEKAGVDKIPLENDSVDKVFTCNTVYFWPEPLLNAQEILRVLKTGGTFLCGYRTDEEMDTFSFVQSNKSIFQNTFSEPEMKQFLQDAGFSKVEIICKAGKPLDSHFALATK